MESSVRTRGTSPRRRTRAPTGSPIFRVPSSTQSDRESASVKRAAKVPSLAGKSDTAPLKEDALDDGRERERTISSRTGVGGLVVAQFIARLNLPIAQ